LRSRGDTRRGNGVPTRKVGCCNTADVEPRGLVSVVDTSPFGRGLRHWRRIRGVSQLELASSAETTTRHVSFLETGRSRPSREMVDRLGDALTIPLRERNRLLEMAGLPPGYVEGDLESHDLAPFQAVIDRLLAAHDPYPGFVLDRHWNIIQTNRGSELFLANFDARNIIELALGAWRPLIENWTPVATALKERLAADLLRFPYDHILEAHHDQLSDALGPSTGRSEPSTSRVICPHFRFGDTTIRTITIAARFESVADITLDEIRVELTYPEDDTSERFFRDQLAGPRSVRAHGATDGPAR
jgi:transcriptional regulator with XRE-family HTH domain